MKKDGQVKERWDIIEFMGDNQTYRSLLHEYDSLEEATAEVRRLNKKSTQTSFFVRDLINESQIIDCLKRG